MGKIHYLWLGIFITFSSNAKGIFNVFTNKEGISSKTHQKMKANFPRDRVVLKDQWKRDDTDCGVSSYENPCLGLESPDYKTIKDFENPWEALIKIYVKSINISKICYGLIINRLFLVAISSCLLNGMTMPKKEDTKVYFQNQQEIRVKGFSQNVKDLKNDLQTSHMILIQLTRNLIFSHLVWPVCLPQTSLDKFENLTGIVNNINADQNFQNKQTHWRINSVNTTSFSTANGSSGNCRHVSVGTFLLTNYDGHCVFVGIVSNVWRDYKNDQIKFIKAVSNLEWIQKTAEKGGYVGKIIPPKAWCNCRSEYGNYTGDKKFIDTKIFHIHCIIGFCYTWTYDEIFCDAFNKKHNISD